MALGGNLVLQTANNPGTSTFNLIAPPAARTSFVAACGIGQVYYFASDAASWEVGVGTVASGSPDTLSRDTVFSNSLGTTARINFTSQVLLTNETPAERDVWASADNASLLVGNRKVSQLLAAASPSDAPRLDQVAERYIATYSVVGGGIFIPLPNMTDTFNIELRDLTASAATQYYVKVSIDNGASFLSSASEYNYCVSRTSLSPITYVGVTTYGPLTTNAVQIYNNFGNLVVEPSAKSFGGTLNAQGEIHKFNNAWTTPGASVMLLITGVTSPIVTGRARLLQRAW